MVIHFRPSTNTLSSVSHRGLRPSIVILFLFRKNAGYPVLASSASVAHHASFFRGQRWGGPASNLIPSIPPLHTFFLLCSSPRDQFQSFSRADVTVLRTNQLLRWVTLCPPSAPPPSPTAPRLLIAAAYPNSAGATRSPFFLSLMGETTAIWRRVRRWGDANCKEGHRMLPP
jgi:hypothetical protein